MYIQGGQRAFYSWPDFIILGQQQSPQLLIHKGTNYHSSVHFCGNSCQQRFREKFEWEWIYFWVWVRDQPLRWPAHIWLYVAAHRRAAELVMGMGSTIRVGSGFHFGFLTSSLSMYSCIVKLKIRLEFGLGSSWVPNFWVFLAGFDYLKPSLGRAALRPPPKRDQVALLSQLLAQIAIDPHHQ